MANVNMLHLLCVVVLGLLSFADIQAQEIGIYELQRGDLSVKFTNYGATMLSLILPDQNGKLDDIVLGYDSIDEYKNDTTYFGALVGRVANRISGAQFIFNGTHYHLNANEGPNMLHGGSKGFGEVVWSVQSYQKDSHVSFTYNSFDGEEGFSGNVSVMVTYVLIESNKLGVKMEAKALDKPTPVNLALHTYWNLGGHNSGDILSHEIQIMADSITPVDDELIPTGQIKPVNGTPYDFLLPRKIGSMLDQLPDGYDINYVLKKNSSDHLRKAVEVYECGSGRTMELWTTQPGLQFYTSNQLVEEKGKGGSVYRKYAGIALETQGFPDSVNHPNFPSQMVMPGQTYQHVMIYRFTTKKNN